MQSLSVLDLELVLLLLETESAAQISDMMGVFIHPVIMAKFSDCSIFFF